MIWNEEKIPSHFHSKGYSPEQATTAASEPGTDTLDDLVEVVGSAYEDACIDQDAAARAAIRAVADALSGAYTGDMNEDEYAGYFMAGQWLRQQVGE